MSHSSTGVASKFNEAQVHNPVTVHAEILVEQRAAVEGVWGFCGATDFLFIITAPLRRNKLLVIIS